MCARQRCHHAEEPTEGEGGEGPAPDGPPAAGAQRPAASQSRYQRGWQGHPAAAGQCSPGIRAHLGLEPTRAVLELAYMVSFGITAHLVSSGIRAYMVSSGIRAYLVSPHLGLDPTSPASSL